MAHFDVSVELIQTQQIDVGLISDHVVDIKLVNAGLNDSLCPIIDCVDGGEPSTVGFGPVNGLLNGGTP